MALTSASTLDDAKAQLNNNLSWEGDLTKAQNALEAVRWIIANRPQIIATNDRSINFQTLGKEYDRLTAFIDANQLGNSRASFTRGQMNL